MTLTWYTIPVYSSPAAALEAMAPFGVQLVTPFPESARYFHDPSSGRVVVCAGRHRVYDDGRIEVRPYSNLTSRHLTNLIAATSTAFNRDRGTWWKRRRKSKRVPVPYYWRFVCLVADDTEVARVAQACTVEATGSGPVVELTAQQVRDAPNGNPTVAPGSVH
ncbi:hypothetical protein [uncultured Tessaracoccus sp.]|uniref:hypothetical protein n=1 Tax=uncultured Tessaracoccus sp. TaxID=905023 RepID=UPI0025D45E29|nr:hypothetical protein [uncultured Tessaracoccus sp.]